VNCFSTFGLQVKVNHTCVVALLALSIIHYGDHVSTDPHVSTESRTCSELMRKVHYSIDRKFRVRPVQNRRHFYSVARVPIFFLSSFSDSDDNGGDGGRLVLVFVLLQKLPNS